jgi:AsmA family protein
MPPMDAPAKPAKRNLWLRILLPPVIVILLLFFFWNWDWFIPLVQVRAAAALGRPVTIEHLHVHVGRSIIVRADGITLQNPQDFPASEPPFGHIDELQLDADLLYYIQHGALSLPLIIVQHPVFNLRESGTSNNYTLPASPTATGNPPRLGQLIVNQGEAIVILPSYRTNFALQIQTRDAPPGSKLFTGGEIVVDAKGTYAGAPITGRFIGGALLTLRDSTIPYPVVLHVENGTTTAKLAGTLNDPAHLAGAQLRLSFAGQNMADLYQLTGVPIPDTPPYSLTGKVEYAANAFRFEDLQGRVGSSDLEGSIAEAPGSPRRTIKADLTSNRVDLTDLAGFLGGTPGNRATPGQNAATEAKVAQAEASPRLLPDTPINLPKLNIANVDLTYHGAHIINRNTPLDNLTVHLIINNGRITADPLNFAVGTGTIASALDLTPENGILHAQANIDFRRLQLSHILTPTAGFAGSGTVGGAAHITGEGNSVAAILGHGNGHAALFLQNGGNVSALMVDLAGLEGGDAILSALGIPVKTPIECMVSDFTLTDGQMKTNALLLATKEDNILGDGTADLTTEQLDLHMWTDATHFSIGSLSTPINIGGTLKHPRVLPAPGPLVGRLGGAIGLGIIFPPLAILPTIRLGLGDQNACEDTIIALHQRHARYYK